MGKKQGTERRSDRRKLTERDRYWLKHLGAWKRSGKTARDYAEHHGVSLGAWYEAKRRLVRRGAWPAPAATPAATPRPRFVPVAVATPGPPALPALQLRLATGVTLEWTEAPSAETLAVVLA